MSNTRFSYRGAATIGGLPFPAVQLRESTEEGELQRSWEGLATFSPANAPEGFPASLERNSAVPVELPDGRRGTAHVQDVDFDGARWTVRLLGEGLPPA